MMLVKKLTLKDFRCFSLKEIEFESPISCIIGPNGSGKTSILEALHYACYFKSFKTHSPKELVKLNSQGFHIKIAMPEDDIYQIGFAEQKRLVKFNNSPVVSFKEHFARYTTVTLTEDDIFLIKGAPEVRRSFLDQLLILENPIFAATLSKFRHTLESRNALLNSFKGDMEQYELWTRQLWQISDLIREKRIEILNRLESICNFLLKKTFEQEIMVKFEYPYKKQTFEDFFIIFQNSIQRELIYKRSLLGAHLDDFNIVFKEKTSRKYASRGQQKLLILIIKLAQLKLLSTGYNKTIFLLDDFTTDLDSNVIDKILNILPTSACQIIFTSPGNNSLLQTGLNKLNPQNIVLEL